MISIVIPAYNEEKTIVPCLTALNKLKIAQKYEVIVVNNNSTDKTVEVIKPFTNKLPLRIVNETKKGRSPARRAGFAVAKGDIIFSTDADAIVPPDWIKEILPHFSDPNIVAVSGTCKIHDCSLRINTLFNFIQPLSMKLYRIVFGHYWLSGFSFAIRKETYHQSGGFHPTLNIQEDIDLAFRVARIGKIKYIPRPVVLFSGRRFQNGLLQGLIPYVKSYYMYSVLKKEDKVFLSDVR